MMRKTNISDDATIAIARRLEEIAEQIRLGDVKVLDFMEELGTDATFMVDPFISRQHIVLTFIPLTAEAAGALRFDADGRPRGADDQEADHA